MKLELERNAPIIYEESVASTNTRLKALAVEGLEHGTVLIAQRQTAGRGRRGKNFESPAEGLYLSLLLRPDCSPEESLSLAPCTALAVCRAVEKCCALKLQVKWPNDLLLNGKKLCGILAEQVFNGSSTQIVLGIGLNVNTKEEDFSPELRDIAGSILSVSGEHTDMRLLTEAVIEELDRMYGQWCQGGGELLEEYRSRCMNVGEKVYILRDEQKIPAYAEGINKDFSLLVRYEDGSAENISYGEVSIRSK